MESQDMLRPVARAGGQIRLIGIVVLILGILAVTVPEISGKTISVMVGILLVFSGFARTVFAWLSMGWGSMFLKILAGVVTIVAGGYMIANPDVGSRALAIVLTIYLFADGITTLIFALRMPPAGGGAWMLLGAIASLLAGVFMWMQWPASGDLAIGILIGIKLMIDGIVLIGLGSAAKAIAD